MAFDASSEDSRQFVARKKVVLQKLDDGEMNEKQKTKGGRVADPKKIAQMIPSDKRNLFAFKVDWAYISKVFTIYVFFSERFV